MAAPEEQVVVDVQEAPKKKAVGAQAQGRGFRQNKGVFDKTIAANLKFPPLSLSPCVCLSRLSLSHFLGLCA